MYKNVTVIHPIEEFRSRDQCGGTDGHTPTIYNIIPVVYCCWNVYAVKFRSVVWAHHPSSVAVPQVCPHRNLGFWGITRRSVQKSLASPLSVCICITRTGHGHLLVPCFSCSYSSLNTADRPTIQPFRSAVGCCSIVPPKRFGRRS